MSKKVVWVGSRWAQRKTPEELKIFIPYNRQMRLDKNTLRIFTGLEKHFEVKPRFAALAGVRMFIMMVLWLPVWVFQKLTGREVWV